MKKPRQKSSARLVQAHFRLLILTPLDYAWQWDLEITVAAAAPPLFICEKKPSLGSQELYAATFVGLTKLTKTIGARLYILTPNKNAARKFPSLVHTICRLILDFFSLPIYAKDLEGEDIEDITIAHAHAC